MDPRAAVVAGGGLLSTPMLRRAGCSEQALTRAVRSGDLLRVCKGWYTTLDPSAPRVAAVRVGGLLTGISGLHELGAWALRPPKRVHVAVPTHSSRLTSDDRVVLHWEDPSHPAAAPGIASLSDALVRVALDEPLEVSVPCFDWAIATNRVDLIDLERVFLNLPAAMRELRSWIDPRSQSVLESVARVRLLAAGWKVQSQVRVGELGRIDLVVEDQVALELDGRSFHEATFESDRRKDLAITLEGHHSIRVSASMLRDSWTLVEKAVSAALTSRSRAGKTGDSRPVPRRKLRARVPDRNSPQIPAASARE